MIAEFFMRHWLSAWVKELQWGRDQLIAELFLFVSSLPAFMMGFNGAAIS